MSTKDYVLQILKQTKGFVSGEIISQEIGVSRMAVSIAVKSLRNEGYDIDAITRRGYRLNNSPDRLSLGELLAHPEARWKDRLIYLDTVDSTNKYLKDLADRGAAEGTIVVANEQTQGKGRRGRQFVSPKDKGVYLSVLHRPELQPSDMVTVTAWVAVAMSDAIANVAGVTPSIKWVNDLMLDGRKIAGILTEMSIETENRRAADVIIGVGINANHEPDDFPEELRDIAGSVAMAVGHPISRADLAASMSAELEKLHDAWPMEKEKYLEAYRSRCATIGQEIDVIFGDVRRPAKALAVNEDFSLQVEYEDGTQEALSSGEVSTRLK